jgi:FHS family L-fucose permease-like MFS transporter
VAYFGFGYFVFSPVAGEVLRRKGYKTTIIMGLGLYSIGAILFWPVAHVSSNTTHKQAVFGGFVACTGVIACGLASLEVAANSYVSVMPDVRVASFRLQFSQAFNGVASFCGPFIASKYFFEGEHANSLTNVQWVYLAVALMGVVIALAFAFTKLPEVSEDALEEQIMARATDPSGVRKPLWRETRAVTGAIAQFLYVGAQVGIGALMLNYTHENAGIPDARGSQLLSYGLILFTVGRFVGAALLSVIAAPVLLFIYAVICAVLTVLIGCLHGYGGVAMIMVTMFFESIMYPTIFVLATTGLGRNTRRAAAMVVMGVSGGAVLPPAQAAIADGHGTRTSYFLFVPCFAYIALWALWVWHKDGRQMTTFSGAHHSTVEHEQDYPATNNTGDLETFSNSDKKADMYDDNTIVHKV